MADPTKYESYESGADVDGVTRSNLWRAQMFAPEISHVITRVKIYGRRGSAGCGTLTISIRATSGGNPINPDLATVTLPEASMPGSNTWIELDLSNAVPCPAGVSMAMVGRTDAAGGYFAWRCDQTSPTYPRGYERISGDGSDGSWSGGTGRDLLFQDWGFPSVETYEARNVQAHQATGVGFLYDADGIDEIGFEWGKVSGGPYPDDLTFTGYIEEGTYSDELTSLDAETTYYYRAKIHHTTYGWAYGAEQSFTTTKAIPTVRTDPPTDADSSSIDAVGNITSIGSGSCDSRGFVYGLTSKDDPGNVAPASSGYDSYSEESGTFGTGEFTAEISGLTQNKIYYLRAWAHNSDGYSYGEELMILTNENVLILYTIGDSSKAIRFDSSPGDGPNHPGSGTVGHYVLVRAADSELETTGSVFGYIKGNFIYERHYYNDDNYTDLFALANPYRRTGTVIKIKYKAVIGGNNYPYGKYKRVLKTHGTTYEGTEGNAYGGLGSLCEIFSTNPYTGDAWTISELDDLIAGIKLGTGGGWGTPCCDMLRIFALWADAEVQTVPGERIDATTIRLHGLVIEDEAEACTVHFEWGPTVSYGNDTADQSKAKGDTFSADITTAEALIHYRAVIETECGETFYGADRTFPGTKPWSHIIAVP